VLLDAIVIPEEVGTAGIGVIEMEALLGLHDSVLGRQHTFGREARGVGARAQGRGAVGDVLWRSQPA